MINFTPQRFPQYMQDDWVLAAVAIVAGVTYEVAYAQFPEHELLSKTLTVGRVLDVLRIVSGDEWHFYKLYFRKYPDLIKPSPFLSHWILIVFGTIIGVIRLIILWWTRR